MNTDPERLRQVALAIITEHHEDYDYVGIGEYLITEEDFATLDEEEFEEVQQNVDNLIKSATIKVSFPAVAVEGGRKLKGWLS